MRLHRFLLIPTLLLAAMAVWPTVASAQRRAGPRVIVRGGIYGGPIYRPLVYDPWFSFGWPYYGYHYQFGYQYPPYGYYGYGRADVLTASVRLEVTPRDTEVYVDGFRAGVVDDFDGFFQRLRMRPGEHDVVLYKDGFKTVHQRVYLNSGADQKVHFTMVPLQAGEQSEPRPQAPTMSADQPNEQLTPRQAPRGGGPGRGGPGPGAPGRFGPPRPQPGGPMPGGSMPGQNSQFGAVSVRVQPADADVLIDGEKWNGSTPQERIVVQLGNGRHHVEIRKDGFDRYTSDVDVRAGETVNLNVSLLRREQ